jgi:hypothetical protein
MALAPQALRTARSAILHRQAKPIHEHDERTVQQRKNPLVVSGLFDRVRDVGLELWWRHDAMHRARCR